MAELFLVERRRTPRPNPDGPPDLDERQDALNIRRSWIVEAPAGSGKTGLLMQRLLKLLGDDTVAEPEQVLAITFTVKATAELRERVLEQLEGAARPEAQPLTSRFDRETRELAEAVLRRDAALGWGLRQQPNRLRVRTIDSVCAEIAGALPVLSGGGRRFVPVLDATPLFRKAARHTLLQLGGDDPALDAALQTLLLHRDGDLAGCERLLAEMLQWREQWGSLIPLSGASLTDAELDAAVLPRLERSLDQAICAGLTQLAKSIPPTILDALVFLASEMGNAGGYKGAPSPIALCQGLNRAPADTAEHLDHWRALIHLLITKDAQWRRSQAKHHLGFEIKSHHAARLKALVDHLAENEDLLLPMERVRRLPPAKYPREQWRILKALFRVLARALAELQLVFAERGQCDFTELSLLARTALARDHGGDDLAAALGLRLQHLLVDEMQDTSTGQYELIERLTEGWDGQSQTVFLVGDPRQSIYLFRQARVERFVRVMRTGKLAELTLGRLRLSANFRSQATLVEQSNEDFSLLFPAETPSTHPEDVPFVGASPVRPATPETTARTWQADLLRYGLGAEEEIAERRRLIRSQAQSIRDIAAAWRARPLPPGRTRPWSLAVLVRSRTHLAEVVAALKQAPPIPFRAVEIESLAERQEILDLFALTRALLHPADRVAGLAIVRAPWCGLMLNDLHQLAGGDDDTLRFHTVAELMEQRGHLLTADGQARLARLASALHQVDGLRGTASVAAQVEQCWRALGGDLWLGEEELANTTRFFRLLDELEADTSLASLDTLGARLQKLFAVSAPADPGAVDLMTIHKAKGLEWDVVMVPGLERASPREDTALLQWCELDTLDPESAHVMLAPIAGKGQEAQELNAWMRGLDAARHAAERKRLVYVAATRAREELHLFAIPHSNKQGQPTANDKSLLQAAWRAARPHLDTAAANVFTMPSGTLDQSLALAAGADPDATQLSDLPAEEPPPLLRRLPLSLNPAAPCEPASLPSATGLYTPSNHTTPRPEGDLASRALGNAVHLFLESLAHTLADGLTPAAARQRLPGWLPRIKAVLRSEGLAPGAVDRFAQRTLLALDQTLRDPAGQWLLSPHPGAATEQALTQWTETRRGLRLDRTFYAGPEPLVPGFGFRWIVDFKSTTHGAEGLAEFLAQERRRYTMQMDAYARALGAAETRLMLFYPLIPASTWWLAGSPPEV